MPVTRRPLLAAAGVAAAAAIGTGLYLFQPWALIVDERVSEALPVAATSGPSGPSATPGPSAAPASQVPSAAATDPSVPASSTPTPTPAPAPAPEPVELARGELVSHEHSTTGTARVLLLDDGTRVLRLEGLDTSNGPDLHVRLSDAPVLEGRAGWFVFDDGRFVDLGELRGNQGDANYEIPADVDLDVLTSISVWCERFAVSFGAAALT